MSIETRLVALGGSLNGKALILGEVPFLQVLSDLDIFHMEMCTLIMWIFSVFHCVIDTMILENIPIGSNILDGYIFSCHMLLL